MKKKIRRLRLDRETIRQLTPDHLERVAGGIPDSRHNSCTDFSISRPYSYCNSCHGESHCNSCYHWIDSGCC
ncbi:MAG: class I lanthipeptide [Holophagales bacterium]|nr:class I lanthipeptide [Holophagales bacterium]